MRGGKSHEFAVEAVPGSPTCPVDRFQRFVMASKLYFEWDWDDSNGAYVFPLIATNGSRKHTPLTASYYGELFRGYMTRGGLMESESLHGLRAGGALSMALKGESLEAIMLQGYWKSPAMAQQYVGVLRLISGDALEREMGY